MAAGRGSGTFGAMGAVVLGLHVLWFAILLGSVPPHGHAAGAGVIAFGTGLTAYTFGLRHAFDADHIAAIDNTTRKLLQDGGRPVSVGLFFSLGHSTIVFGVALAFVVGVRGLSGALHDGGSALHSVTALIGTGISGTFLYIIAALNAVILAGIVRVFVEMRNGCHSEQELARRLEGRGLMNRWLGRFTRAVSRPWHMYPIGLLFGLGFDTASEVALLFLAAGAAGSGVPLGAILCLPILFAAGMSLLDTIDGCFMNAAYGWAFSRPVRKIFYNIAITALSVAVSAVIGTLELGGLIAQRLHARGPLWHWLERLNVGTLGVIVVAMFVMTWAVAVLIWRVGRIEERLSSPAKPRPLSDRAGPVERSGAVQSVT